MTLENLVQIFGDGNFKLCDGKRAVDANLYSMENAQQWLDSGGTIGLWCPQGFVIIDIDDKEQAQIMDKLTNTLKCETPHGMHFYFRSDKPIRQVVKAHTPIGLAIDTRTPGKGYCVLPFNDPNRRWIDGEIEQLPFWIEPLSISSKAQEFITVGAKNGDGRNDSLIRHIMRLRKEGYSPDDIWEIVNIINSKVWAEPLNAEELKDVISHANKYTPFEKNNDADFCLYSEKGTIAGINHKALVDYMVKTYPMFTLGGVIYFYKDGVFNPNPLEIRNIIKLLIREPKYQKQSQIIQLVDG